MLVQQPIDISGLPPVDSVRGSDDEETVVSGDEASKAAAKPKAKKTTEEVYSSACILLLFVLMENRTLSSLWEEGDANASRLLRHPQITYCFF